jgi:hypothetical protein
MAPLAALRWALATALLALLAADRLLDWRARRSFIPEQRMSEALSRGSGCVLVAGDSRMVAGVNERVMEHALRANGRNWCVASIAIGALPIHGVRVAFREYLERGGMPRMLVLGASEDSLLAGTAAPDPSALIGNEAVSLAWSEPSDVRRLYPDFPWGNLRAFDQGLRFLVARSSGLGSYASLVWQKVQAEQDRVTGRARASNRFGALDDMEALGHRMEATAREQLSQTMQRPPSARLHPALLDIEDRARVRRIRFVLAELPMPAAYRSAVTETEAGRRYLEWLRERTAARGGSFIDLTRPNGIGPRHFADFVHLNTSGAERFSIELANAIARLEPP